MRRREEEAGGEAGEESVQDAGEEGHGPILGTARLVRARRGAVRQTAATGAASPALARDSSALQSTL